MTDSSFNLTWSLGNQMNAASLFYVKYRKSISGSFEKLIKIFQIFLFNIYLDDPASHWLITELTTDNTILVTDLDSGTRYEVKLVSTTGTGESSLETESDMQIVKTLGTGKQFY